MTKRMIFGAAASGLAGYGIYELFRRDVNFCNPTVLTGERNTSTNSCPVVFGLNFCDLEDIRIWNRRLALQKMAVQEALLGVSDIIQKPKAVAYDDWLSSDPFEEAGGSIIASSLLGDIKIDGVDLSALNHGKTVEAIIESVTRGCSILVEINQLRGSKRLLPVRVFGKDKSDDRRLRSGIALIAAAALLLIGRRF